MKYFGSLIKLEILKENGKFVYLLGRLLFSYLIIATVRYLEMIIIHPLHHTFRVFTESFLNINTGITTNPKTLRDK